MTRLEFRNRLCLMRAITRRELVEAGVISGSDDATWKAYSADPVRWFLLCDGQTADRLWRALDQRASSACLAVCAVNWSNAAEATKALDAGILPPGCFLNTEGALVIPDRDAPRRFCGSSVVLALFDKIVTMSGDIVKSRDEASPALKAARAL